MKGHLGQKNKDWFSQEHARLFSSVLKARILDYVAIKLDYAAIKLVFSFFKTII